MNTTDEVKSALVQYHAEFEKSFKALQEQVDGLELKMNRPGTGGLDGDFRGARRPDEITKSMEAFARKGDASGIVETKSAAMRTDTDPASDYLVAEEIDRMLERLIYDQSVMRQIANV